MSRVTHSEPGLPLNSVARRGNEGGIGKKHVEMLPTGFGNAGKYWLFYF